MREYQKNIDSDSEDEDYADVRQGLDGTLPSANEWADLKPPEKPKETGPQTTKIIKK